LCDTQETIERLRPKMEQAKPSAKDQKAQEAAAASAKAKKTFDAAASSAQSSFAVTPGAGMPAARILDMHICPQVTVLVPHVGGPIIPPTSPTVLIGSLPAARVTDRAVCVGPIDMIVKGSTTVLINSLPAARVLDLTAHGGMIIMGLPTVLIGG
jgi:uncharacterized Zn-binding protein involved in type VI secretion